MVSVSTLSFGPVLTKFRRLRYRTYHFCLPRGLALRLEGWETDRFYHRLISNAATQKEREELMEEAYYDSHSLEEQLDMYYSGKLLKQARRLFIPHPRIVLGTDDPNWQRSDQADAYYLSPEGIQRLRALVREERRQRREAAAFWLATVGGTFIGIIGALTGLVALLKK